ncbi:MAG: DM13 domain-containing protein [Galbibacter orientalis]|uniref:DM13 domain-containing protein n=1 Tax=Galbibacter orientalis TaxID=453852 RepID=UPI0030039A65
MKTTVLTLLLIVMTNAEGIAQKGNQWVDKVYSIRGNWSVQKENKEMYFVLGGDFYTLAGPDLKLYLSQKEMSEINNRDAIDKEGGVYVASLKSNKGAQKYKFPPDVNIADYKSLVIHCQKFSVVWGGIDLMDEE